MAAADTCVITVEGVLDPSTNLTLASIVVGAGACFMDFMTLFSALRPACRFKNDHDYFL
jgi:hypothetical protein